MTGRTPPARTRRTNETFDAPTANKEMAEKLRRNGLRRLARTHGLELRQSSYGYSLIDADRRRIDDRNDLTLDEVARRLKALSS